TAIEDFAFFNCRSLERVNLPESLEAIGESAFGRCERLESIVIPASVERIGSGAFSENKRLCLSLADPIESRFVLIDDVLYSKDVKRLLHCPSDKSYCMIPEGVEEIAGGAFSGCEDLKTLRLPDSIRKLGASSFDSCESLQSINLPPGLESIGESCFADCLSLRSIVVPGKVSLIEEYTFSDCENLGSVTIPQGVVTIGSCAFEQCAELRSVMIPPSVQTIEVGAFSGTGLEAVQVPGSCDVYTDAFPEKCIVTRYADAPVPLSLESLREGLRAEGRCQYCGGGFKGMIRRICSSCGTPKDY
ncbi:MAG: leucine-rich repeat domain-containing protein, partial [Coriobacteriales bacterium]|nr:leucine-rich repeat domain-containing protein [Coriobacteriales bacterium]